ncbi:hypothetical protein [Streptomyces sp. 184]|uniref:hypothetical protein n=1 Tax=Streptomyces sp. 184 TaxID=1827526 RepID=UPI003891A86E
MTNGNVKGAKQQQVRESAEEPPAAVRVTSFTYGRGPIPAADITLDLRQFGDSLELEPDSLIGITICDTCAPLVPGADGLPELVEGIVPVVRAFRSGPGGGPVTVAVGSVDGRVSATVATAMHRRLGRRVRVTVEHLRPTPAGDPARPAAARRSPAD